MAAKRRDLQRERSWRRVMSDFRASGLGVRDYCLRHGLVESSFHYWRRELDRRATETAAPAFVPVTVVSAATIEVRCPSGHVVSLPSADRDTLRHLFAALVPEASC